MDPSKAKRQKLLENSRAHGILLHEMNDWEESNKVAIKYCKLDESFVTISYKKVFKACKIAADILEDVKSLQFVGIASDIPAYCVPALMIGIMSSGRAFVCLPCSTLEANRISENLNILHVFLYRESDEKNIIRNLVLHDEKICLAQLRTVDANSEEFLLRKKGDGIFAYATTTSGSTGESKIVRVTHASIIPNILDLKEILNVCERDAIAQLTPFTFDPSVIEIFLSISCGATLLMFSRDLKNNPEELLRTLLKRKVSFLQSTPSLLLQRWSGIKLRKSLLGKDSSLRILLLGGEDFPSENILSKIRSTYNETRIFDIYGITEVSCWATIREHRKHYVSHGLGKTMSETILEVRNKDGNSIKDGEGILHIGSSSRICVIDNEDTSVLNSPTFRDTGDTATIDKDGNIHLKGRRDRRIKRYGTKVYLSDVENHVKELSFIENCYAVFMQKNQSLHLFFTIFNKSVNQSEKEKYESEVLAHAFKLSDIQRPDKVVMLKRFELTGHGKICKRSLNKVATKLARLAENKGDPLNAVKTFENIWQRFLPPGGEIGFLNSGGTSVTALRIANEFEETIGRQFPKILGLLLSNENLNVCRDCISKEMPNLCPMKDSTKIEEIPKNNEQERAEPSFVDRKTESIKEPQKFKTENLEKILPWQKCRGRSNFPTFNASKQEITWKKCSNIRLEKLFDLGKCVDASPTIFSYPGGKNYATVGSHAGVICTVELSKENSFPHWKFLLPNRIEASILVIDDFRGVVGSYDTFVYCIHLKTGEIFWKFKTGDIVKCTAVLCSKKQNIFVGSYDRNIYCISLEDGSKVWGVQAGNGSICATPCIDDKLNCVLFGSLDGTCVSLKQNNGAINWYRKLDYPVFSAPIILDTGSAVFCDVSGKLHFLTLDTGEMIRTLKIDGNIFSHLHVRTSDETRLQSILFASENKNIYKMECSVEITNPIFRFTRNIGAPSATTPFSDGRIIVVASNDGNLKILDFTNGEILYNLKLGSDIFSSPIIHENFIVVGCRDNNLYILSINNALMDK